MNKSGPARVVFPFVGDSVGGAQICSLLLIQNLNRSQFDPLVVLHQKGPLAKYFEAQGQTYEYLPLSTFVGSSRGISDQAIAAALTIPRLIRFFLSERVSLVHTQDGRMNLTWALPARLSGCRFVWHQRAHPGRSRIFNRMVPLAHRVLCVSHFVAEKLPSFTRTRQVVIDDPHDTAASSFQRGEARAALSSELGCEQNTPIVGFFGNLTKQKRPNIFLEAASLLLERVKTRPLFLLFGADRDGLASRYQMHAESLGISDNVRFMGFRSPAEPYMSACDLIIAPAVDDAFPRVLIEAMLMETPVVAARSGGHEEILKHGESGLLVAPDEAAGFAEAALALLEDRAMAEKLGRTARENAVNRYSVKSHVEAVEKVYRDILG